MGKELQDYTLDEFQILRSGEEQKYYRIFNPNQGYGPHEIQGQSAQIKKVEVRLMANYKPVLPIKRLIDNVSKGWIRVIVFIDKQPTEDADYETLLQDDSYSIVAFRNLDYTSKYSILSDDTFCLKKGNWSISDRRINTSDGKSLESQTTGSYNFHGKFSDMALTIHNADRFTTNNGEDEEITSIKTTVLPDKRLIEGSITQVETEGDLGKILLRTSPSDPAQFTGGYDIYTPSSNQGHLIETTTKGITVPIEADLTTGTPLLNKTFIDESTSTVRFQHLEGQEPRMFLNMQGGVSDLQFDTKTELPTGFGFETEEAKTYTVLPDDIHAELPIWDIFNPPTPPASEDGLHGEISVKTDTGVLGEWTGDSTIKSYYVDTNFIWTKDLETGAVKANDIRIALLTHMPVEYNDNETVLEIYYTTRIRFEQ